MYNWQTGPGPAAPHRRRPRVRCKREQCTCRLALERPAGLPGDMSLRFAPFLLAAPVVQILAQSSEDNFQLTIGEGSDWPGATGLAYRFIDSIPSRAVGGVAGGWVVGGWAQGASGVARVAENGTVLWSHKLHFHGEPGRPNSQTVVHGVAAMVDYGVVVAGYTYHAIPAESYAFVLRLDDEGEVVYSRILSHDGQAVGLRITGCAAAADGGVMLVGTGQLLGAFSLKLGRSGDPQSGWVTDHSGVNHARDLKELPNGHFVYSGNEFVPNDDDDDDDADVSLNRTDRADAGNHWLITELDPSGRPTRRGLYGDTEWGHNTDIVHVDGPPGEEGYLLSGHIQNKQYETSKLVLRVTEDLQTVVWARHLQDLPRYINDHSSQGVVLSTEGLVVVTGIADNRRSIASFLNYSTGQVALAKHYGRDAERSHMQRVTTTRNGGLLFVGNHEVRDPNFATLTYMVKTGARGDSGCPGREADIVPAPMFDDAGITASMASSVPAVAVSLSTEASSLQLSPWAKEQHIADCE
jgi:hypothetical protein